MGMTILKAVRGINEEDGPKIIKDGKKVRSWPKIRVAEGHLFGHPNAERVKRLLSITPPIVVEASDRDVVGYVEEAVKGRIDPKTKSVLRAPIHFSLLNPAVQEAYKRITDNQDGPTTGEESAAPAPRKKSSKATETPTEEEDDDTTTPAATPTPKAKAKGKGKGKA